MVVLAGQTIEGGEKSVTIITCKHELLFPQPSLANQVRLIVISTGQAPPIVTSENVIIGEPVQLSVAVAVPVAAGSELAEQLIVVFGGHVIAGAWLSSTKMD